MKKFLRSVLFSISLPFASMQAAEPTVEPIVILGGGIGSLTSAIYLARAGLSPLVIEGSQPGGLLTQSHSVQNWPGELEIEGVALTEKIRMQAEQNGTRFLSEEVINIDFSKRPFKITTRSLDGKNKIQHIAAESCIIAMGTNPNFLGIPGEKEYWGKGVTNCAICDGSLYKDQVVGVVGGGDAAVLEALYLSNIAKEVHIFIRKESMRAIEEKRLSTLQDKPNVHFHFTSAVQSIQGDEHGVTSVMVKTGSQKPYAMPLNGLFLAIGSTPNTSIFQNQLTLDAKGYILLQKDQQTSINGIYAIGDIVDPVYKQAISAAGDGAKAALQAQQYISDRADNLAVKSKAKAKKIIAKNETVTAEVQEVIDVTSLTQFEQELANSDIPIAVDFYATWCGPCKQVSPIIETSAAQLAGKVKFLKINVDKFENLSATYNIRAMPTMILLDASGNELDRKVGPDQIHELLNSLQNK